MQVTRSLPVIGPGCSSRCRRTSRRARAPFVVRRGDTRAQRAPDPLARARWRTANARLDAEPVACSRLHRRRCIGRRTADRRDPGSQRRERRDAGEHRGLARRAGVIAPMNEIEALAAAVEVENQAIYGYGVAGAHFNGGDRARALAELDTHRARRDRLVAMLIRHGATPPVSAPAYKPPFPVSDAASGRELCATLEDACTDAAWDLVAASAAAAPSRSLAVGWLSDAAVAAASWRGAPAAASPAMPGQPS